MTLQLKILRNIFRMKKEIADTTVKVIKNLFRQKKENEEMENRIKRGTMNLFDLEEKVYYKM